MGARLLFLCFSVSERKKSKKRSENEWKAKEKNRNKCARWRERARRRHRTPPLHLIKNSSQELRLTDLNSKLSPNFH
ncbi:Protein CBG25464 [Caenorhabditis briggsae]|uniref:Protein CBG25464 n=1 Tax=Caenorhabditis briggsae TaxID=6238 RepID=B6ILZ8_CAEBR|nr:Protein CBG25464 [Caenorhabditis briggsae]CAS00928.1 Protein CBG25464 [Caenorhabditis briggsae]